MFPIDAKSQALLQLANNRDPLPGMGSIINKTKNCLKAIYDFTVEGGAIGTVGLLDEQGNPAILPQGAYVTNVVVLTQVAPVSAGSTTVSIGSGLAVADLLAATAKASLTLNSLTAGVPVGTAATWVGPIVAQTGSQVTASIAVAALTAGKLEAFIEYVIAS